jgi:hypothetical protein
MFIAAISESESESHSEEDGEDVGDVEEGEVVGDMVRDGMAVVVGGDSVWPWPERGCELL